MANKVDEHVMETFGELDPSGKDPHEAGAKLDAGKNRLGLVLGGFSKALQEVGKVGTFGANKYTDNGWLEVPNGQERYTDAMLRHYFKEVSGEDKDEDSDLLHAAHLAWNALARLELALAAGGIMRGDRTESILGAMKGMKPGGVQADERGAFTGKLNLSSECSKIVLESIRQSEMRARKKLYGCKDDERMNIIARNGNDGLHYAEVKPHEDDFQE